jgi:hypothetical protein
MSLFQQPVPFLKILRRFMAYIHISKDPSNKNTRYYRS